MRHNMEVPEKSNTPQHACNDVVQEMDDLNTGTTSASISYTFHALVNFLSKDISVFVKSRSV
jgi:hypothetical protein